MTFLFTDVEGSTRLWEEHRASMSESLERHDRILREAVTAEGGTVFATGGDGFSAAFQRVPDALEAAFRAQVSLEAAEWELPLRVRMAVHTGEVERRGEDYFGPPLNRCARLMKTAHGGQVLCSAVAANLAADQLPADVSLRDLGQHRLRDLSEPEHVFQLVHPSLRSDFPPLRSLDVYPGNLPIQPSSFVGRELLVREAVKALTEARIVTLIGVGGVGKTRTALHVAADIVPKFRDGAWLVELAMVSSADAFEDAVATALGVRPRPGTSLGQCLGEFLRDKQLLLVLDNCEHLLDRTAAFVEQSVGAASGLKVLATSREGLSIAGERIIAVPSLSLPGTNESLESSLDAESVRLFMDRAQESDSTFRFGTENADAIAELCRRLDGVPLAVELAAARVGGMTPAEITTHLDRRFQLLSRGRRTATTRHQALRNTIDWSYDLLDETERLVLRRLAVFAGDFDGQAAEAVVPDADLESSEVLDLLLRLVDKSLLVASHSGDATRYRLLETVRDYAWERLEAANELDTATERHARHYAELAVRIGPGLETSDELVSCQRVEVELDNFRAALRWAVDNGDPDLALSLIDALMPMAWLRSVPFGVTTRVAADMPEARNHPLRPMALGMMCQAMTQDGKVEEALEYADATEAEAQRLLQSPEYVGLRTHVSGCLSMTIALTGQNDRLNNLARNALGDARSAGLRFEVMRFLIMLSSTIDQEHHDDAVEAGEEALRLARQLGVPSYLAWAPMMLAGRLVDDDPMRAETLLSEAATAAARAGNTFAQNMAELQLASVQAAQGNVRAASLTLLEQAESALARGDPSITLQALASLVPLLVLLGHDEVGLLVGVWAECSGVALFTDETNPTFQRFHADAYKELRDSLSEDERRALSARADEFAALDLMTLARQCIEAAGRETP